MNKEGAFLFVMRKSRFIILSMSFLFVLAACGGGHSPENALDRILEEGTVKIGFANEAPYAYEENGELKGAAVEIAKAVFAEMGVHNIEGELQEFGNLIPGVQNGKFDVITAGMAITPDRCKSVAFGEPEIQYGEGMVVRKGNPENLKSYEDIAANPEIKVAVMSGATEIDFLLRSGVSEDQIQRVPDIAAGITAVQTGRAHVTTATELTVQKAMLEAGSDELEFVMDFEQPDIEGVPSYGAAAFHKDAESLREAYNEILQELKESGKILEIIEDEMWGEKNIVDPSLTTAEICAGG